MNTVRMLFFYKVHNDFIFLQQLKQQRDKLKQYQKKINVQIEKDRNVAKTTLRHTILIPWPTCLCSYPTMLCAKQKSNKQQYYSIWIDMAGG
jgi:hypothetical protein